MHISFLNKIPFLITLIPNIEFTATSQFPTQKSRNICKAPSGAFMPSI